MINFDFYRNNPTAAATLISKTSSCYWCPLIAGCDESDCFNKKRDSYSSIKKTQKCFSMWENYFKNNPEELDCMDNLAEILGYVTDCNKCVVSKANECDYIAQDCKLELLNWLCNEFATTCQKSRQVGLEGLHPDDAKAVEEVLEQASNDTVHHPNHYQLVDGIEVIDVIKVILNRSNFTGLQGYCLGNVLKYVLRADMKNGKEDYEKAEVYLDWLIRSMLEEKA